MNLHIPEVSCWYVLLGRAQVETGIYLPKEVESYLVQLLFRMTRGYGSLKSIEHLVSQEESNFIPKQRLLKHLDVVEQCLLLAGLFPEHAAESGLPLQLFIDKGTGSSHYLSQAMPETLLFNYMNKSIVQVVDVLQCVTMLSGGQSSANLFQAFELWQSGRSKRSLDTLIRETASFPGVSFSDSNH